MHIAGTMARTRRRIALPQNLRARIIASLVAVGLLPILVALALNIAQSGGSRGVVDDHFQLLIGNTSNGIKQSLERGGILTQMVAQDPVLRDADSGRDELEDRLVYFNGLLPQFHHLTVVSRSGTVLASSTYNYRGAWEVQGVFRAASAGQQPVMLCSQRVRRPLRRLLERALPNLPVMAYAEVSSETEVESVGMVEVEQHAA